MDAQDTDGNTALHYLLTEGKDVVFSDMMGALLKNCHANPLLVNSAGLTPVQVLQNKWHCDECHTDCHANPLLVNSAGLTQVQVVQKKWHCDVCHKFSYPCDRGKCSSIRKAIENLKKYAASQNLSTKTAEDDVIGCIQHQVEASEPESYPEEIEPIEIRETTFDKGRNNTAWFVGICSAAVLGFYCVKKWYDARHLEQTILELVALEHRKQQCTPGTCSDYVCYITKRKRLLAPYKHNAKLIKHIEQEVAYRLEIEEEASF